MVDRISAKVKLFLGGNGRKLGRPVAVRKVIDLGHLLNELLEESGATPRNPVVPYDGRILRQ